MHIFTGTYTHTLYIAPSNSPIKIIIVTIDKNFVDCNFYLFFCKRTETVEVLQTYQYADPADEFEREPFSVLLRTRESGQESPCTNT